MRAVNPKNLYRDDLAAKRRQRIILGFTGVVIAFAVMLAGLGYAVFYSSWFRIWDVTLTGSEGVRAEQIKSRVEEQLNRRLAGIPVSRNILFFRSGSLEHDLKQQFSFLKDLKIDKKYFHGLSISVIERKPEGVWCFATENSPDSSEGLTTSCYFFDHEGNLWGNATQTYGFLLLNVDDLRIQKNHAIEPRFLETIQAIAEKFNSLNIGIKKVIIPANSYTEVDIDSGVGYLTRFSVETDVSSQLETFRIFRDKKILTKEVTPVQYLDLRFDGRVYYK